MAEKDGVTAAALKMAWKMIDTIFVRHDIPPADGQRLLNILTAVSMEHLLDVATIRWTAPEATAGRLFLEGPRVWNESSENTVLKARLSEEDLDLLLDEAEELLDRYHLDEEEKATLFTALPCVGLSTLEQHFIKWLGPTPFVELG